jgi:hypothetical protein
MVIQEKATGGSPRQAHEISTGGRLFGRDSSVSTATRYRLDSPGIESRLGDEISRNRPARPAQPPIQWVPGLLPGLKRPGRSVDHPPQSSAEVKEKVELYLYQPSGPVLGYFTFTFSHFCLYVTQIYLQI